MKKVINWQVNLGIILLSLSAALYYGHYLIFRDAHHIFIYLLGDIAFIPIYVLIVTVIIHQLLDMRTKADRMDKMNMVIGVFYSEAGWKLLSMFSNIDRRIEVLHDSLKLKADTPLDEFERIKGYLKGHAYEVIAQSASIEEIKVFLTEKRDFFLRLLENPNLLEHEAFTELLRATFHLTEELTSRTTLKDLPAKDYEHMAIDIKRVYGLLVIEWISYMKHLKTHYPYLFSLALRTNPFDKTASVIIK